MLGWRCINQQERRIQIARRRRPRPSAPASALQLLARDKPKSTGVAPTCETHGVFIGGADAITNDETIRCRLCRRAELHVASEQRLRGRGRGLDDGGRVSPENQHHDRRPCKTRLHRWYSAIERRRSLIEI